MSLSSLILILPFLSVLTNAIFPNTLGKCGVWFFAIILTLTNTIIITLALINKTTHEYTIDILTLESWIESGSFIVHWNFVFDRLNMTMLLVVNSVSLFVYLYSLEYMVNDAHLLRFLSYISLFTFFMIDLCSYLLTNFWFTRINANKALIWNLPFVSILTVRLFFNTIRKCDAIILTLTNATIIASLSLLNGLKSQVQAIWRTRLFNRITLTIVVPLRAKFNRLANFSAVLGLSDISGYIHQLLEYNKSLYHINVNISLDDYSFFIEFNITYFISAITAVWFILLLRNQIQNFYNLVANPSKSSNFFF